MRILEAAVEIIDRERLAFRILPTPLDEKQTFVRLTQGLCGEYAFKAVAFPATIAASQ